MNYLENLPFIDKVKQSQIPHPTSLKFSLKKWKEEYEANRKFFSDDDVFIGGLLIFHFLNFIRVELKKFSITLKKEKRLKIHAAFINRTLKVINDSVEEIHMPKEIYQEQILQLKSVNNPLNKEASYDDVLDSLIDGAKFPILFTLNDKNENCKEEKNDQVLFNELNIMLLGQYYSYMELLWTDILWNNRIVELGENQVLIKAANEEREKIIAVSRYRFSALGGQILAISTHLWNDTFSDSFKKSFFNPEIKIEGTGKKRNLYFHIMKIYKRHQIFFTLLDSGFKTIL